MQWRRGNFGASWKIFRQKLILKWQKKKLIRSCPQRFLLLSYITITITITIDRSSGCRSICSSGCDPVADLRLHVRLQARVVLESNSRQAVGSPPEPDPGDHDSTAAGTDVHVHHHDACPCLNHQPCDWHPWWRADHPSKEESDHRAPEQKSFAHGVDSHVLQSVI